MDISRIANAKTSIRELFKIDGGRLISKTWTKKWREKKFDYILALLSKCNTIYYIFLFFTPFFTLLSYK